MFVWPTLPGTIPFNRENRDNRSSLSFFSLFFSWVLTTHVRTKPICFITETTLSTMFFFCFFSISSLPKTSLLACREVTNHASLDYTCTVQSQDSSHISSYKPYIAAGNVSSLHVTNKYKINMKEGHRGLGLNLSSPDPKPNHSSTRTDQHCPLSHREHKYIPTIKNMYPAPNDKLMVFF